MSLNTSLFADESFRRNSAHGENSAVGAVLKLNFLICKYLSHFITGKCYYKYQYIP